MVSNVTWGLNISTPPLSRAECITLYKHSRLSSLFVSPLREPVSPRARLLEEPEGARAVIVFGPFIPRRGGVSGARGGS